MSFTTFTTAKDSDVLTKVFGQRSGTFANAMVSQGPPYGKPGLFCGTGVIIRLDPC